MDAEITKSDGTSFLLSDFNIEIDDFRVGSITIDSQYGTVEGRAGRVDYGATHGTRTITLPFHIRADDLLDYPLLRDKLYELVLDTDSFFIRELRRPKPMQYDFVDINESAVDGVGDRIISQDSHNVYVGGKRYLVRVSGSFDIEQTLTMGEGEMSLETTELPYAESIGTTQDIHQNGIDANDELWGFGMGLITDPNSLIYTHTGTSFRIYNAGNVAIHPFKQDLKITISEIAENESNNLFDGTYHDWYIYNYGSGSETTAYLRRNYQGAEHTLMVPVTPGETYTIKVHDTENSNHFTVATAPTVPEFDNAGIFDMGRPIHVQGKYTIPEREYTLTIPEGDHYLYAMIAQDQTPPTMVQVESGDEATPYEPYPGDDVSSMELKNVTNGTTFSVSDYELKRPDRIVMDGPNITKNGLQYLRKTNRQYIELDPGWNEFEISEGFAKFEFDFRFYYL
ncbi:hypothetical protein GCM10007063_05510 [Lentibacillus kapialis]|uniref:Siphovirus-type tail component RIFT-related domain-containing protein n=1 Tax=Lentibacillus kapialis TaxID=340214 RepID=A0A917PNX5_9BACI|nr:phage tail domain-containing protein [Lentibacillus kapialis]GGJ85934.1 hypothetical protein GCM10007063_05510 [Lentibacillus kapialis]